MNEGVKLSPGKSGEGAGSYHPNLFLIGKKLNYFSLTQVCFVRDSNWWVTSLSLSSPMSTSTLFFLPVSLRRESVRAAGWAPGSQPRSTHQELSVVPKRDGKEEESRKVGYLPSFLSWLLPSKGKQAQLTYRQGEETKRQV